MKKIIYFLTLCVFVFSTACEKFLEEDPKSFISPSNFYKSENDALAAINAAYAGLQPDNYYGRYQITSSIHGGDGGWSRLGNTSDRKEIIFLNDAGMLNSRRYNISLWNAIWEAVNRANAVITNVPDIEMNATLKTRIIGEAKFLRALSYFNMVRKWGGVPILLTETSTSDLIELQVSRNTAEEVYAQIEQDLTDAIAALPNIGDYSGLDIGRASKEAAQGLLAKAQLYQEKWTEAATNAVAVINSPSDLDLMPDPKDNWWESSNRDNNQESIFEVQYNGDPGNNGHALSNNFEPRNNQWGPGQWGTIHANFYFYNKFDDADKRKAATFLTSHPEFGNESNVMQWWEFQPTPALAPHVAKFREPENSVRCTYNVKILRFADILLVAAEATNESEGPANALQYVNRVRTRAGLPDLPAGISQADLRDSIYLEFRKELCYEGQDYEELVRTERLLSSKEASWTYTIPTMYEDDGVTVHEPDQELLDNIKATQPEPTNYELDAHNVLWPIPQPTIDMNPNLKQNSGY